MDTCEAEPEARCLKIMHGLVFTFLPFLVVAEPVPVALRADCNSASLVALRGLRSTAPPLPASLRYDGWMIVLASLFANIFAPFE
jgi:hypothetical protein